MVTCSLDIETYHLYNGTKESEEFILEHSKTPKTKEYFINNKKAGFYYPVLNSREFTIGAILRSDRKKPVFFYNHKDMLKYILDLVEEESRFGHNVYFYGHNIRYDLYSFLQSQFGNVNIIKFYKHQPPIYARIGREGTFTNSEGKEQPLKQGFILDTYEYYKMSLANVGKMLNFPKLEMPPRIKDIEEIKEYLTRDVEVTLKIVEDIKNTMNEYLGYKPNSITTAPTLSMKAFKYWVGKQKYKNSTYGGYLYNKGRIHQSKHTDFIRKAYRGGRNECFNRGEFDNVTGVDINSTYPYIFAKEFIMPDLMTEKRIKDPEFFMSREQLLSYEGVSHCTIKFPTDKKIMYLGHHYPFSNSNLYFSGAGSKVKGYWTNFEIKRAIEEGYIVEEIHESVIYEKNLPFNPFKEYMEEMYKLRKSSPKDKSHTIKLLMNSLYGKFGQENDEYEEKTILRSDLNKFDEEWNIMSSFDNKVIIKRIIGKRIPKHAHIIIATLVTARARDYLYKYLNKIPFDDLLYCATDSIYFKGNHLDKFPIGKGLGEWDIVKIDDTLIQNQKLGFVREGVYYYVKEDGEIYSKVNGSSIQLNKEQLWGKEEYKTLQVYTHKMGYRAGNFNKVGTFIEMNKRINPNVSKRSYKFPEYFEEYSEGEKTSMNEIVESLRVKEIRAESLENGS